MRIFIRFVTTVFFIIIIFLFSAHPITADKYETVSITIHGKKLLGTGPYKKAVVGEIIAYEDACCKYDFRRRSELKVLNEKIFKNFKVEPTLKSITVRKNGKIRKFYASSNVLIVKNGKKAYSLGTATLTPMEFNDHARPKGYFIDVYMLLDKHDKVKYIETFPVIGIEAQQNIKPFNVFKMQNYIIVRMCIFPYDSWKTRKIYKIYFERNCIVTRNYQPADFSALNNTREITVYFNQEGKAKRIDTFTFDVITSPGVFIDTENKKLQPMSLKNKLYRISEKTKIFTYGWSTDLKHIYPECCTAWVTLNRASNTVDTIVLHPDD